MCHVPHSLNHLFDHRHGVAPTEQSVQCRVLPEIVEQFTDLRLEYNDHGEHTDVQNTAQDKIESGEPQNTDGCIHQDYEDQPQGCLNRKRSPNPSVEIVEHQCNDQCFDEVGNSKLKKSYWKQLRYGLGDAGLYGMKYLNRVFRLLNIVYPEDSGAVDQAVVVSSKSSRQPAFNRALVEDLSYHGLPGDADQNGAVKLGEVAKMSDDLQIVFEGLAESYSGIEDNGVNTRLFQKFQPMAEEVIQLPQQIPVDRVLLHGFGIPFTVHQHIAGTRRRTEISQFRILQTADVVDQMNPRLKCSRCHLCLGRID